MMEKEVKFSQSMLWVRLAVTFNLLYQKIKKDLARENLTVAQLDILVCLDRTKGLPLSEVAERLLVTGGSITGIIDRLEKAGYVLRDRDARDRRIVRAKLTEKGYEVFKKLIPRYIETVTRINSFLTPAERRKLRQLLKKLSTSVKKDCFIARV